MIGHEADRTTAENYRRFGEREAAGKSPLYAELAAGIAGDDEVLALVETLPAAKRQPNLVLAAARYRHGTPVGYGEFRRRLVDDWPAVRAVAAARSTQTNEVGRCAALLPLLAELPGPLALLEVGASAGLCLLLDRYRYDYGSGTALGPADGPVTLTCELRGGTAPPSGVPRIAWRAGLDLDPVDLGDPDAVRWLEALVWPGEDRRLRRLRDATAAAVAGPPRVERGDLRTDLARLAAEAPADATLVVFHSAVLAYLTESDRNAFSAQVSALAAVWVANEAPGVVPLAGPRPAEPDDTRSAFLLSCDGTPVAWADPHGAWLRRIPSGAAEGAERR